MVKIRVSGQGSGDAGFNDQKAEPGDGIGQMCKQEISDAAWQIKSLRAMKSRKDLSKIIILITAIRYANRILDEMICTKAPDWGQIALSIGKAHGALKAALKYFDGPARLR